MIVNSSQIILQSNSILEVIFGFNEGEMIGKSLHELIPPQHSRKAKERIEAGEDGDEVHKKWHGKLVHKYMAHMSHDKDVKVEN